MLETINERENKIDNLKESLILKETIDNIHFPSSNNIS